MLFDRLRAMAEAMPPGGAIVLPVDWLRQELEQAGSPGSEPLVIDLTVADLVGLLGKRPSTVRSWLSRGLFPGAYVFGKQWRIPRDSVVAFQARAREQGGHPPDPAPRGTGALDDYKKLRGGAP